MDYTESTDTEYVNIDYVPNNNTDQVSFKLEEAFEANENADDEYRILDISSKHPPYTYTETSEMPDEYSDDGEDNDEERGVLKHAWPNEDPNAASDDEEQDDPELKASMSNIIKFINFLNKLQEDHQQFVNSGIPNFEVIEDQKQTVVIDAHMLTNLVKSNFDHNNVVVNEIVAELKKELANKVELFDKLHDKRVNGVIPPEVIKRLFSGNNLLIKTQIDELRRILFSKLDVVNKMCILKKQKLKIQKQYLRKTPVQKVKVFTPTPSKRPIGRKMTEFKKRQEEMVIIQKKEEINTMEKEINKTIRDINEEKSKIQKHIEKLKDECRLPKTCQVKLENLKDTYSNSSLKAILTLANGDVPNNKHARKSLCVEDYIQRLFKDDGPEADPENNDNYETESQDDSSQKSGLEDFDSFTEVISKKLNIKPEEASPSLILSKFRNNLNKKLQQSRSSSFVDESEVIELGLDDFKEEEHLVEEIFYEGIDYDETFEERVMKTFSGDWSENNAINNGIKQEDSNLVHENENSSYIIQDLNEYRPPSHSKEYYNINDVTIMKLPVASHQPSSSPPTENTQQIENTFNSEEQSSLRDREEGMSNLRHMENSHSTDQSIRSTLLNNQNKPTETKAFIRRIIQSSLETKLADLEAKAELARLSLQHLNEKKFKANRELKLLGLEADAKLARQSLQQLKEGKYTVNHEHENIEHNITSEDNTLKLPYVFENDNKCLKKTFSNENSLDHKLKSLFKNNNLRNLLKRKLTSNESDKNDLGSEEEKRKRDSLSSHQMSDLEGNEMQEDRGTATENVNIDEQIATSSSTNHKAKMVLDKPKLCETKNMAKNVENKRTKNNERKTKIVVQEVHDFGLRRNIIKIDKKKSKKPRALTLPGESSKLLLLKSHAHRIESKTKVIKVKAKRKQPNKEKFEEFDSSDKSKQLLENLKQQIFNKLHRQENTKRATEVKQEIERRLRRKEKLKAKRKK